MNILKLVEFFKDENSCMEYLANLRWEKDRVCPYCKSTNISRHTEHERRSRFQCSNCKSSFSPTVNTIFHNTKLPLLKWFLAISLLSDAKKSISSRQLARHLELPVKTAYSLSQRIRKAMYGSVSPLLQGIIEMDETYIGGKPRFHNCGAKRGRGTDKTPVFGMVERKGSVIAKVAHNLKGKSIKQEVLENIDLSNSVIYTDEYRGYNSLKKIIQHETVNHGIKEYVRGDIHTNTIEGFWSILKRAWYGQHHHYSEKYMSYYISEAAFKYNMRKNTPEQIYHKIMGAMLCINL
jgi:transposase-like protein